MRKVWKYTIKLARFEEDNVIHLDLPQDAEVLTVRKQYDKPQIWVMLDPEKPKELRKFLIRGTNHPINDKYRLKYIGTILMNLDRFVLHFFEVLAENETK